MTTTVEIAENALNRSIENLKSSASPELVADIIKDMETSRDLMRLQRLLEIGYTLYQLADIFRQSPMSDKKREDLKTHYNVHSCCGKNKPDLTSKCPECLLYRYSIGWFGNNPLKWVQEKIIQEIESKYTPDLITDIVKYVERIKSNSKKMERIKIHKRFIGVLDCAHDPYNCDLCTLYPLLFPQIEMDTESKNIIEVWTKKYLN
jgi:hypothetical protein